MDAGFWLTRWRENRIGWHQSTINPFLAAHWPALGVAQSGTVFVPLCGKSRDMLWLRDQGYRVLGVELSELAAHVFFAENHLAVSCVQHGCFTAWHAEGVTLLQGDFFDLQPADLGGVGAVYDRASLIALPAEDRARYVAHLLALLPPVPTLLVTLECDQHEMFGPPFSVPESEVRALFAGAFDIRLASVEDEPQGPQGLTWLAQKAYLLRPRA